MGSPGIIFGSSGIVFGISPLFLGYKKEPNRGNGGCFRVFKEIFVLSYVIMCYISQHSDHADHPFKVCPELCEDTFVPPDPPPMTSLTQ